MIVPNHKSPKHCCRHGATLVEAVIAVGVLAVAIPLVLGTIAESGKTSMSAQAETRSTWMIPICMDEIRASRDARPRYFTATAAGESFPSDGEIWALAFNQEGAPVGKLNQAEYDKGLKELQSQDVRYIATMAATKLPPIEGKPQMLRADIFLEYPASSPAAKRRKIAFHTRIP
jgi:type II secretory pathway pseudopilin PulG